jgi:rhodanese-related sulfurtransferase
LLLGFAIYLAWKWWQRYRMIRELRMTRISVAELGQLIDSGLAPTILDVRPDLSRDRDGIIPGALPWSSHAGLEHMPEVGRDTEVIVYCACPNEASAALVARQLKLAGFKNVRPLHGGIDAWIASGLPVDRPAGVAAKQAR